MYVVVSACSVKAWMFSPSGYDPTLNQVAFILSKTPSVLYSSSK